MLYMHATRRILTVMTLTLPLGCVDFAFQLAPAPAPTEEGLFDKIPMVEGATLHAQTLEEAPASVTVITAPEIRKNGYRALKEALSSVRGLYFTNEGIYDYSGVLGLAVPGDYNTRFLVMPNGHPLTDNVYNFNGFFGIRVQICRHEGDRVRPTVRDRGVGLAQENLTRVFAHGFKTKSDGHGFGLHSGALAARQLGGSLWAESEGLGLGATFTLELPLEMTAAQKSGETHEIASLD
jgi:hypothetical protein